MIPGPIVVGALIDRSCILWQRNCNGSGVCLLFDTAKFRLSTYGMSLGFQLISFALTFVLLYFISKMNFTMTKEKVAVEKKNMSGFDEKELDKLMDIPESDV